MLEKEYSDITTDDLVENVRGDGAKKIVGGLKGSEGETHIRVEGEVLLGGESSQKL